MIGTRDRLLAAGLLGVLALGTIGAPAAQAGTPTCRVRNVTQGTSGATFNAMVDAARDGDRLQVRGTCPAHAAIGVDIVIVGIGEARPILTGRDHEGVIRVKPGAAVRLRHLVITGGHENRHRFGGGIDNAGELVVLDSVVRGNENLGAGGIINGGHMMLRASVVRGNLAASGDGGGIANYGTMTVLDSIIEGNGASWDGYEVYPSGGGIRNSGTLIVRRSVVRRNSASDHGGGIHNSGQLELSRSRVIGNHAIAGAGLSNDSGGVVTLRLTRVGGNRATGDGGGIWNGFWDPWADEQPVGVTSSVALIDSVVRRNHAASGGGIWSDDAPGGGDTSVTIDLASAVSDNLPDDCVGTTAC